MKSSIGLIACVLLVGLGAQRPFQRISRNWSAIANAATPWKKHCGTFATCSEFAPAWSPDGTRIAFVSNRAGWLVGSWQLFVIDADGENLRQVTHHVKAVGNALSWSPDGKRIAINVCTKWITLWGGQNSCEVPWWNWRNSTSLGSVPAQKNEFWSEWDIYIVDADRSNLLRLTHDQAHSKDPAWSPDGKRIAFASARSGRYQICTMNLDGSDRKQLIDGEYPKWSPDGKRILFTKFSETGTSQIYSINVNGSDVRRLTPSLMGNVIEAVWSPDSNRIAFAAGGGKAWQVFAMDADGNNLAQLTHYDNGASGPAWSPDGKSIAYAARAASDGSSNIFVMNADGSNVRQITGRKLSEVSLRLR